MSKEGNKVSALHWRIPGDDLDGKARRAGQSHDHEKWAGPRGPVGKPWKVTGAGLGAAAQRGREQGTSSNATTNPGVFTLWDLP